MKKREKAIIITALVAAAIVIILGIIASFFVEKPNFDSSITGNVIASCSSSLYPECNGECYGDMLCLPDIDFGGCTCQPKAGLDTYCSDSEYPECNGYCTIGLKCEADLTHGTCECVDSDGEETIVDDNFYPCTPDIECSDWSECVDGEQLRVCIDRNKCSDDKSQRRNCEIVNEKDICVPDWDCSSWSECKDQIQKRECKDLNNCGIDEGKPEEQKKCVMETAPTGNAVNHNESNNSSGLTKAGLTLISMIISTLIMLTVLVFKKKSEVLRNATPILAVFFVIGMIYGTFSLYTPYSNQEEVKILANAVSIDSNVLPHIESPAQSNMFVEFFSKLSPLKKTSTVMVLTMMFTLLLILSLVLSKRE